MQYFVYNIIYTVAFWLMWFWETSSHLTYSVHWRRQNFAFEVSFHQQRSVIVFAFRFCLRLMLVAHKLGKIMLEIEKNGKNMRRSCNCAAAVHTNTLSTHFLFSFSPSFERCMFSLISAVSTFGSISYNILFFYWLGSVDPRLPTHIISSIPLSL